MQLHDLNVLPLRLAPRSNEAFDGYLSRAARRLHVPVLAMLEQLFLVDGSIYSVRGLATSLSEERVERVAHQLVLTPEQVKGMTLDRYALPRQPKVVKRFGAMFDGLSPWCPRCVREGRWDIRWRTNLMSVCRRHNTYLELACPTCDRSLTVLPFARDHKSSMKADVHDCSEQGSRGRQAEIADLHANELVARVLAAAAGGDEPARRRIVDMLQVMHLLRSAQGATITGSDDFAGHQAVNVREALAISGKPADELPSLPIMIDVAARLLAAARSGVAEVQTSGESDSLSWAVKTATRNLRFSLPPVVIPAHTPVDPRFVPRRLPQDLFQPALADLTFGIASNAARSSAAVSMTQSAGTAWNFRPGTRGWTSPSLRRSHVMVALITRDGRDGQYWTEIDRVRRVLAALRVDFEERSAHLQSLTERVTAPIAAVAAGAGVTEDVLVRWLRQEWACEPPHGRPVDAPALTGLVAGPVWRRTLPEILGVDDATRAMPA